MFEKLRKVEKKFPWSFSGFILAIIFGALSVYLGFFKKTIADLNFIITSNSAVLDIKEEVGKLDVIYDGKSLSLSEQDLKLITLRVINQGDTAITKTAYDEKVPLGFMINDGLLAELPSLISASQPYLEKNLEIHQLTDNSIFFSEVILDPNQYFELKVLILYKTGKEPSIKSLGKIASLSHIDVIKIDEALSEKSFFDEVFITKSISYQLVRVFVYGITFILFLVGFISLVEYKNSIKQKRNKIKIINTFKAYKGSDISRRDELFFDVYRKGNARRVKDLLALLEKPNHLLHYSAKAERLAPLVHDSNKLNITFEELEREELIEVDDDKVLVDEERLQVLISFISYLDRQGEFKAQDLSEAMSFEDKVYNVSEDMASMKLEQLKLQGAVALHEKNYDKALGYFGSYLEVNPKDSNVLWKVAYCYKHQGKIHDALLYIEAAIEESDEVSYLLHYNYACYLSLNGANIDTILEQLSLALSKDETGKVKEQLVVDEDFLIWHNNQEFISFLAEKGMIIKRRDP